MPQWLISGANPAVSQAGELFPNDPTVLFQEVLAVLSQASPLGGQSPFLESFSLCPVQKPSGWPPKSDGPPLSTLLFSIVARELHPSQKTAMPQHQAEGLGPNFPEDSRFLGGITSVFGVAEGAGLFLLDLPRKLNGPMKRVRSPPVAIPSASCSVGLGIPCFGPDNYVC